MFGGQGIYRDGIMFALVADGELYFKADDQSADRFQSVGSEPFTYKGKGKPITMSYWRLPDTALDDPEELRDWADLAYQAAMRAKNLS